MSKVARRLLLLNDFAFKLVSLGQTKTVLANERVYEP